MKESVYIETTIISYYFSRPNRDIIIAGHQQITKDFIDNFGQRYDIFVSELVIEECKSGDKTAAQFRLELLKTFNILEFNILELNDAALSLAKSLVSSKIVPNQYAEDALHIALATIHGMDYLVTWNCKHIANAHIRNKIEKAIRKNGYILPVICTPEELMG